MIILSLFVTIDSKKFMSSITIITKRAFERKLDIKIRIDSGLSRTEKTIRTTK